MNFKKIGQTYFNMNEVLSITPSIFGQYLIYVKSRDKPMAVDCTQEEVEKVLFEKSAPASLPDSVDTATDSKNSPDDAILVACKNGNFAETERFLFSGVNVHAKNACMKYAAEQGNLPLMRLLRRFGADVHANDYYAANIAEKNENLELLTYLVSDCNLPQKIQNDLLEVAAKNGRMKTVEVLVGCGADVHANNCLPYELAKCYSHTDIMTFLAQRDGVRKP